MVEVAWPIVGQGGTQSHSMRDCEVMTYSMANDVDNLNHYLFQPLGQLQCLDAERESLC